MLQVNHIHLSYGPRLVLDDVSFTVAPGEKAGLIGVNGAGKSSLLKIIAGVQEADSGKVVLPRSYWLSIARCCARNAGRRGQYRARLHL